MPARCQKFVAAAVIGLVFTLAFTQLADARSLSGGRTMGRQSTTYSQRQAAPTATPVKPAPQQQAAPVPAPPAAAPPPPRNRWLGPLAGLATGLGIGALMSHFGMGGGLGGGMGGLLLIAGLVMGGIFLYRRFFATSPTGSYNSSPTPWRDNGPPVTASAAPQDAVAAQPETNWAIPTDFDTAGFLHLAKVNFIRLQAAWDQADLDDIREFTTPEMFAEIKLELNDRGTATNHTDVVSCTAELLGIETLANGSQLASVHFSGMMREDVGAPANAFKEVWNFLRLDGHQPAWLVAGIQQDFVPVH